MAVHNRWYDYLGGGGRCQRLRGRGGAGAPERAGAVVAGSVMAVHGRWWDGLGGGGRCERVRGRGDRASAAGPSGGGGRTAAERGADRRLERRRELRRTPAASGAA